MGEPAAIPCLNAAALPMAEAVDVFADAAGVAFSVARAPGWSALARRWLGQHPACAVCGSMAQCVPHHVTPVHVDPSLELNESNLMTACPRCHLFVCHLGDFRSWNRDARHDARQWAGRIRRRPYLLNHPPPVEG